MIISITTHLTHSCVWGRLLMSLQMRVLAFIIHINCLPLFTGEHLCQSFNLKYHLCSFRLEQVRRKLELDDYFTLLHLP
ncbi:hypothetical protein EXN66_Car017434 [Channa argus]|uniref:Uncharacterized protein n=1 Tax=Channa argus TaxID=215402 RepID=A0A6G1QI22_CHAAH|nr:hypothetical protein EXN66_Car017434 [Channa argus]